MGTMWARQQLYQRHAAPQPGKQSMVVAAIGPINSPGVTQQKQGTKISPGSIWRNLGVDAPKRELRKKVTAPTSA